MAYMLTSKEFRVHLRAMGIDDTALMPDEVAQDTAAATTGSASTNSTGSSSVTIGMSSEARAEQLIEVSFPALCLAVCVMQSMYAMPSVQCSAFELLNPH
jgi:hypothetical protein